MDKVIDKEKITIFLPWNHHSFDPHIMKGWYRFEPGDRVVFDNYEGSFKVHHSTYNITSQIMFVRLVEED